MQIAIIGVVLGILIYKLLQPPTKPTSRDLGQPDVDEDFASPPHPHSPSSTGDSGADGD